jgi:general secretion pathway protein G
MTRLRHKATVSPAENHARPAGAVKTPLAIVGFALVELLVAATVAAALLAIALPKFASYRLQAQIAQAVSDIRSIDLAIQIYRRQNNTLPNALSDLGVPVNSDPWGRPYEYLKIEGDILALAMAKKDLFHVPLNSDYDLYTRGADGATASIVVLPASQDDIIRANKGGYVGLGSDY